MHLWSQTDRFETTCSTEYGGLLLRVVAEMSAGPASARAYASLPDGSSVEIVAQAGWESLDDALEACKRQAIAYTNAFNRRS